MNQFKNAFLMFIFMTILTGIIYPLVVTGISQLFIPWQANGSLIQKSEQIIGSSLIAQNTTNDRYFWPRPSAIDYDPMKPSGGSNLGPTSKKLKDQIEERKKKVGNKAPAELLYASGSGLDPHISIKAAYYQIPRIAKVRSLDKKQLKTLVDSLKEGFYVNVLLLNQELDNE